MWRWLGVLVGFGCGAAAGCLLEVEPGPSCGDGYHDPRFEDCDASADDDDDSIPSGCSCDPLTCALHCCGNGVLEEGEACEGNQPVTLPECQQWSCVACQVVCPRCGNGQVDSDEECDFEFEAISTTPVATTCDAIPVPGRPGEVYQPGGSPSCRADCRWDRSTCNLCGNGELDDQIIDPNTGGPINAAERCDGEVFDLADRFDRCEAACGEPGRDCNVTCGEGCLDIRIDPVDPGCCVRPGHARSTSDPCCCELPEVQAPAFCSDVFDPPLGGGGEDGGAPSATCPG